MSAVAKRRPQKRSLTPTGADLAQVSRRLLEAVRKDALTQTGDFPAMTDSEASRKLAEEPEPPGRVSLPSR